MKIHAVQIETKHGTDIRLYKQKPTYHELGLLQNHYINQYDCSHCIATYYGMWKLAGIQESVSTQLKIKNNRTPS